MKRFSGQLNTVVTGAYGKPIDVHMAVYSREYRGRRFPKPPPPTLPAEIMRQIREAAEGRASKARPAPSLFEHIPERLF